MIPAVAYSPAHKASIATHWQPANPSDVPSRRAQAKAFGELSERAELSREVTERHAQALVELGYLELRASGKFRLGRLALWLGLSAVRIDGLVEVWSGPAAHSRAAGLALLAFTADSEWPERTRAWACRDPKRQARLLGELEDVCERRYAISRDGREAGVAAVVLGVSEPVAAVELSIFGERGRRADLHALAGVVVEAADGIAEQLEDDSRTVV